MTNQKSDRKRGESRVRVASVYRLENEGAQDEVLSDLSSVERLELVGELSARMWELTGRPLPDYSRSEMPIRVVPRE